MGFLGQECIDYQFLPQQFDLFKKRKKKIQTFSRNDDTPLCPLAARTHAANQAFAPSRIIEPGRDAWIPDQIIKQNPTADQS